jgi:hypothetical protein
LRPDACFRRAGHPAICLARIRPCDRCRLPSNGPRRPGPPSPAPTLVLDLAPDCTQYSDWDAVAQSDAAADRAWVGVIAAALALAIGRSNAVAARHTRMSGFGCVRELAGQAHHRSALGPAISFCAGETTAANSARTEARPQCLGASRTVMVALQMLMERRGAWDLLPLATAHNSFLCVLSGGMVRRISEGHLSPTPRARSVTVGRGAHRCGMLYWVAACCNHDGPCSCAQGVVLSALVIEQAWRSASTHELLCAARTHTSSMQA